MKFTSLPFNYYKSSLFVCKALVVLLLGFSYFLLRAPANAAALAFPGAEGYGKDTIGGRGGVVCKVTNLNNTGAGSLRNCVTATGPRTVVFEVGGTITLTSDLDINNPYITIAGQTAPGDGILVKGGRINIFTYEIIIRHMRFRNGVAGAPGGADGIQILGGASSYNIIIDHCTISWHDDEGFSLYVPATDITFSYNIVSESLQDGHSIFLTSTTLGQTGTRLSIHHNLLANNSIRNPVISAGEVDFINNVIYNQDGQQAVEPNWAPFNINFIGNFYQAGPDSDFITGLGSTAWKVVNFRDSVYGSSSSFYAEGNISQARYYLSQAETAFYSRETLMSVLTSPLAHSPITTTTANVAYEDVLKNAGATLPARDSIDTRVTDAVRNGTGSQILTVADVGGYPAYASGTAPTDSDGDAMPDTWETQYGLNPSIADNNTDSDGDGYTNLEEFLNNSYPISPLTSFVQTTWEYVNTILPINGISQFLTRGSLDTSTPNQLTLQAQQAEEITNPTFESAITSWELDVIDTGTTPTSLSNLALWFKADSITGLADGEAVTTWNDSSGNSKNATQVTSGNRPLYRTSSTADLPTVDFDGTNDSLTFTNTVFTDLTLFVVNKAESSTFNGIIGRTSGDSAIIQYDADSVLFRDGASTSDFINGFTMPSSEYFLQTFRLTSGTAEQFMNGLAKGSVANVSGFTFGQLGGWGGGGSQYSFDGEISEIIVYSSALSDNDKASIEKYLASKYDLINPNATNLTLDTATTYKYTAGSAQVDTSSISQVVQDITFDDTRKHTLKTYVYTDGSAVTNTDAELYYDGAVIPTTYTTASNGWYLLSGKVGGSTASKALGVEIKANKTVYLDAFSLETYPISATLLSSVFDIGQSVYGGAATYATSVPSGANAEIKIRTSNDATMSDATSFNSCSALSSGVSFSVDSCVKSASRYFQYAVTLYPSSTMETPTFLDTTFTFTNTAPVAATTTSSSSNSSASSSSSSNASPTVCGLAAPTGPAPHIYSIIRLGTSAALFFNQAGGLHDRYVLQYGTASGNYSFGTEFMAGDETSIVVINNLEKQTDYYFKLRAGNGCATGDWSSESKSSALRYRANSSQEEQAVIETQLAEIVTQRDKVATQLREFSITPTPSPTPSPSTPSFISDELQSPIPTNIVPDQPAVTPLLATPIDPIQDSLGKIISLGKSLILNVVTVITSPFTFLFD